MVLLEAETCEYLATHIGGADEIMEEEMDADHAIMVSTSEMVAVDSDPREGMPSLVLSEGYEDFATHMG